MQLSLNKLHSYNENTAIDIMKNTIEKNYQGIFEVNYQKSNNETKHSKLFNLMEGQEELERLIDEKYGKY